MSWLNNMSVAPRTTVALQPAGDAIETKCFNLGYAIRQGIRWGRPDKLPGVLEEALKSPAPLNAYLLLALLRLIDVPRITRREVKTLFPSRGQDEQDEELLRAIREAGERREIHGARLVRSKTNCDPENTSTDFELTLLMMSQSTNRVFVAGKQPVLDRLRPGLTLECLTPIPGTSEKGKYDEQFDAES